MSAEQIINSYVEKISTLKTNLNKTDYLAIKYAEGEITISEYSSIKEQRRAWRAEINALETKLASLEVK